MAVRVWEISSDWNRTVYPNLSPNYVVRVEIVPKTIKFEHVLILLGFFTC